MKTNSPKKITYMVVKEKPHYQPSNNPTASQHLSLRKRLLINLKSLPSCPFCLEILDLFNNVMLRMNSKDRNEKIIDLNLENIEQGSYFVKIKPLHEDAILQHIHL